MSCKRVIGIALKILSIFQVGTVLNAKDAKSAVNAGAKFLMSPAIVKVYFRSSNRIRV